MSKNDNKGLSTNQTRDLQPYNVEDKRIYFDYKRLLIKVLRPTEFVILEALNLRANPRNDGWCWPSLQVIAEDTGITSPTTIISAIKRLKELGVLEVNRSKNLFYRPIKPSPELVTKLVFMITPATSYSEEVMESLRVPVSGTLNLQNLESSNISKNGVPSFQNLEDTVTKNGRLRFQKMKPNELQRIKEKM